MESQVDDLSKVIFDIQGMKISKYEYQDDNTKEWQNIKREFIKKTSPSKSLGDKLEITLPSKMKKG